MEVVRRRGVRADHLFVSDHSAAAVRVIGPGHDLTTASAADAGLDVAARAWAVLRIRDEAGAWQVVPVG